MDERTEMLKCVYIVYPLRKALRGNNNSMNSQNIISKAKKAI